MSEITEAIEGRGGKRNGWTVKIILGLVIVAWTLVTAWAGVQHGRINEAHERITKGEHRDANRDIEIAVIQSHLQAIRSEQRSFRDHTTEHLNRIERALERNP